MCGSLKMPGVKRCRDESDNEEVDQDSESDHTTEDDFNVTEGSESEESSDLDEQECDERRLMYATDVADLEKQFSVLREQLYRERLNQVEERLSSVRKGEAAEYLTPLNQLREAYTVRLEVADVMRKFRLKNIHNKYEAELLAANQNYENEKVLLMCSLWEDLEERIRRLQEDRQAVTFTSRLWAEKNLRRSSRASHKASLSNSLRFSSLTASRSWIFFVADGGERKESKAVVDGPYIVYRLRDEDILEDWTVIRRAVQASKQRKNKWTLISGSAESEKWLLHDPSDKALGYEVQLTAVAPLAPSSCTSGTSILHLWHQHLAPLAPASCTSGTSILHLWHQHLAPRVPGS
ncbi:Sds3-like [Trinorchestia longiramus]|nr:Sds3-like [Trinorchestia longiramus]